MNIIETERLTLRKLTIDDAPFVLELLNEPAFIQYIGDRNVHTRENARDYILNGPIDSYARFGFGLYLTELKDRNVPIGICGLLKRDSLKDVDVGFAFLKKYWSKGYAFESASAVIEYAKNYFKLKRIVAITNPDNFSSMKLLGKLGFVFEKMIRLSPGTTQLKLFVLDVA